MQILECLDEVSLVVRGIIRGMEMDHPPVVLPTMAGYMATLLDEAWALFNAPQEALVPFSPTVK